MYIVLIAGTAKKNIKFPRLRTYIETYNKNLSEKPFRSTKRMHGYIWRDTLAITKKTMRPISLAALMAPPVRPCSPLAEKQT